MKSDLIDIVHEEHAHLSRLLGDLKTQFESIARGEIDGASADDLIDNARSDLQLALDEMLHHFAEEEEVFFVEVQARFPELKTRIAHLVETHEFISSKTQKLQKILLMDVADFGSHIAEVRAIVSDVQAIMVSHTNEENDLFGDALRQMTPEERTHLLGELRKI